MQDQNTVALVGRLTRDPELRALASGTSVCQFRLAFNTSKKNSSTGQWEDVANFIDVTVWGNHGETCSKYLSKGKRVALQGRLQYREWESNGNTRSTVEIVADRVQFIEPKGDEPARNSAPRQAQPPVADDDDIPF